APLSRNAQLHDLLSAPDWPAGARDAIAWLGESIAIKDPAAAHFRRQPESHLLIMGQDGESALGVMTAALLGLAAQSRPHGPTSPRFYVLDGTPDDAPWAGGFARAAKALPHEVTRCGRRDAAAVLAELEQEVNRRSESDESIAPDLFL